MHVDGVIGIRLGQHFPVQVQVHRAARPEGIRADTVPPEADEIAKDYRLRWVVNRRWILEAPVKMQFVDLVVEKAVIMPPGLAHYVVDSRSGQRQAGNHL